ncbi:DNA-3-methyladenine glycosylase [Prunus dulcis]|uniref:DNA-3-methyladenine glycosylase II n=1 Tax=Prunus dulcis TaxID=3755 RepID=A0A4Y1RT01_PRUDU|nr:DNA-3-methyladenine glycosylase [Prunus dulcis]
MLMRDEMKRTRRSKQVTAKSSKSPIPANRIRDEDDDEAWPSQPSESLTVTVVKPKKSKSQLQTKPGSIPDNPPEEMTILPFTVFQIDALDLAPRLLGKFLRRDDVVLQITEVEAYRQNDSACHGRFGVTARTAPLLYIKNFEFGPGGNAYVYLCYGLHTMLNVVADKEGVGAAVLIRSCAPVSGLKTIQQRRGQKTDKPVLLNGPGKIGQALGLSTEWSNHPLYTPGGLEILDGPEPEQMLIGPRVGIEYALPEHVNALWRFAVAGTSWISAPKNTLRPP